MRHRLAVWYIRHSRKPIADMPAWVRRQIDKGIHITEVS